MDWTTRILSWIQLIVSWDSIWNVCTPKVELRSSRFLSTSFLKLDHFEFNRLIRSWMTWLADKSAWCCVPSIESSIGWADDVCCWDATSWRASWLTSATLGAFEFISRSKPSNLCLITSSASISLTVVGSRVAKNLSFSSIHSSTPSVSFWSRMNESWSFSFDLRSLNMSASSL